MTCLMFILLLSALLILFAVRCRHSACHQGSAFRSGTRLLLLCAGLSVAANSVAAPDLRGENVTAVPGQEVYIPVDFVSDGAVVALQFDVSFNASVLSITTITPGTSLSGHTLDWQEISPGLLRLVFTTPTLTVLNNGSLANIGVQVSSNAGAGTEYLFISSSILADSNAISVVPSLVEDASVTIQIPTQVDVVPIPTFGPIGLAVLIFMCGLAAWVFIKRGPRGVALSLALGLTLFSSTIVRAVVLPGDANGDGSINAADIPVIVNQILERSTAPGNPDCNSDTLVDVRDTICEPPVTANRAPDLFAPGNRVIQADTLLEIPLLATDPDAGDVLAFSLDTFPTGMIVNSTTGLLIWSPSVADIGSHAVTASVTDSGGLSDAENFVVEVIPTVSGDPQNSPPQLTVPGKQETIFANLVTLSASATDPDAGDVLTFSFVNNPLGMTINSSTGAMDWTPLESQIGLHDVAVKVQDQLGAAAFGSFIVDVLNINRPPVAVDEAYLARIGETLSISPPGVLGNDEDPDNDPLVSALVSDVANGVLDFRADGSFDYTPELPVQIGPVELEEQCELTDASHQTNGTIAVGDVDNDGVVEVVGTWFNSDAGKTELWVMSAEDCSVELDSSPDVVAAGGFTDGPHLGLLDIDGDGDLEIIGPRMRLPDADGGFFDGQHLVAVHHDGTLAWPGDGASDSLSMLPAPNAASSLGPFRYAGPTFADLDADGSVEIIMTYDLPLALGVSGGVAAFNTTDGSLIWEFSSGASELNARYKPPVVADIDRDGTMEIIFHTSVLDHTGALEFTLPAEPSVGTAIAKHLDVAVVNMDGDGFAEIFGRDDSFHYVFEHDGTLKWQLAAANTSRSLITAADFDGDGEVEFAYNTSFGNFTATGPGYMAVYDTDGTLLWSHELSSELHIISTARTRGPSAVAFDANEDGAMDIVIHHDNGATSESGIYIFDGIDGSVLDFVEIYAGGNAGDIQRLPTIVDIDDDGEAEIISSYNGGASGTTKIWQGSALNPLPSAPAMRDQWLFNAAHVDDRQQEILTNPTPHWLQPRFNGHNIISSPDRVYTQLKCEAPGSSHVFNGTIAVGDVDYDGDIEIIGQAFISNNLVAELWLLNAEDCSPQTVANVTDMIAAGGFSSGTHMGLLDIDSDGDLEIIGSRMVDPSGGPGGIHLLAVQHDGSLVTEWGPDSATDSISPAIGGQFGQMGPTFADIDANGTIEIIMPWYTSGQGASTITGGMTVFNAADGTIMWEYLGDLKYGDADFKPPLVADIDLDGTMEIIFHTDVIDHMGVRELTLAVEPVSTQLAVAVANFDADPYAEILAIDSSNHYLFNHDGSLIFEVPRQNNSQSQIAIADFDGDHELEYAWYNGLGSTLTVGFFEVYESDGSVLWSHQGLPEFGEELSRFKGVNPTAFDANSDGAYDLVVYLDVYEGTEKDGVYIFDGLDGSVLEFMPIRSNAREQRFPTIADIDNDSQAEIITSHSSGLVYATRIWEGAASHPLPAAPAHRNQWIFNEAYADEKGNTLSNPTPHWLLPGLNGYNLIKLPPHPLAGTVDSFTYKASDGLLDSNVATVSFDVQPAGTPPAFLSQPDTLTTVGFAYVYEPYVVDTDPGDSVSFILTAAPSGMSIDPSSGKIEWAPDTVGSYSVAILASDTIGFATPQAYTLVVGEPVVVPDVVGQPEATAESTLNTGNLLVGSVHTATHPAVASGAVFAHTPPAGAVAEFGGAVDLMISLGPAPEDIDDDGDGFTENEGDCDDTDSSIKPGASDAVGDGIDQDCDGIDGSQSLSDIVLEPTALTLLENEAANLIAYGVFDDGSAQKIGSIASWSSSDDAIATVSAGTVTAVSAGIATITASHDAKSGSTQLAVVSRDNGDDVRPLVSIISPVEGETVTQLIDISGTASDANLVRYRLELALADDINFTLLKEGTSQVSNGVLGQLDPTLLVNGLYTLRLTALDAGGNSSQVETTLQLDGLLKVGQFSISFVDSSLPASGLPLEIVRTYDSRNRSKGDFGVGWELSFKGANLTCTNPLGEGWAVVKSGISWGLTQTRSHTCSVQIPGQRAEIFDFSPDDTVSPIVPFSLLSGSFKPRLATRGNLVNLDGNFVAITDPQPGPVRLLNDGDFSLFAPNRFRYTQANGTMLGFSAGELISITDLAGNTISIGPGGMTHSNGRGFTFERDDSGRITQVTDPKGNEQQYLYNASGDLVSHVDALGNVSRYLYNQNHGLLRIEDPLNRPVLRNEYDDEGRLIRTIEPDGRTIELDYSAGGQEQTITDIDGSVVTIKFDPQGNVTEQEDALGGKTLQSFDAQGNLLSRSDENGHTTNWTYDANGNKLSQTNALGETRTFAYDDNNNVSSASDALGHTTSFVYGANGLPTSRTNTLGVVEERRSYDGRGNLISRTDAENNTEVYSYNSFGDPTSVTDARGNQATYNYDANGALLSKTDKDGRTTKFSRNASGKILTQTDPLGRTTEYVYDAAGQSVRETDPTGATVENQYNDEGKIVARVDALGESTVYEFSLTGDHTRTVSPGGLESVFEYDALNRQTRTKTPGGQGVTVSYDGIGNVIGQNDAAGHSYQVNYDAGNRPITMTGPDTTTVNRVYDAAGNLIQQTDARGNVTKVDYDSLNRPVRIVFADGSTESMTYDAAGNLIQTTDSAGQSTAYQYDANDNLVGVRDSLGAQTRFEYDANDRRVAIVNAHGNRTTMQYDAAGQMTRRVYPGGSVEQWQYDPAGRLSMATDPDGDTTQYTYDAKGRLISKTYADSSEDVAEWNSDDQLILITSAEGSIAFDYNSDGQLSAVLNPDGSSIAYAYDAVGAVANIITRTTPAAQARTTQFDRDGFGRIVRVEDPDGAVTNYEYDAMGNLTSASYANGAKSEYQYDMLNRAQQVMHFDANGIAEQYSYTFDALGNRTRVTTLTGAYIDYDYDVLSRLTLETHFDAGAVKQFETSYEYDAAGNRTRTVDQAGQETIYVYNDADQLLSSGDTTYNYDPDGNLSTKTDGTGATIYEFDVRNQLIAVQNPSDSIIFAYDARGELIRRSVNGLESNFLVGIAPANQPSQVLVSYDSLGNEVAENIFGNHLVSRRQGGLTTYAHMDASLNVRLLTDGFGTVSDHYNYDAFGNVLSQTGVSDNPYQFAGERSGEAEGLTYLRARYYEPKAGRFISRDPFAGLPEDPMSLHRYQYGHQNPLIYSDPDGELTISSVISAISIGGLIVGLGVNYGTDVKSSAKELKGLTRNFKAKFCRGALLGGAGAIADQTVLIGEDEPDLRPTGPRAAKYNVFAFGIGLGVGVLGSNFGKPRQFKAPGTRSVDQFEGTGRMLLGGVSVGRSASIAGIGGEGHLLPERSKINVPFSAGLTGSALGTTGVTAADLTTFWTLVEEDDTVFKRSLGCSRFKE